jgi:dienelactone hydrolase
MRITFFLLAATLNMAIARDVQIPAGKATIAGTFLVPASTSAVPCVVILGGTLSHTRDGALTEPGVPNRNALKRLAEALAQSGYASLRYDKVGYGQSKRGPGWSGSFHDEAAVAAAAISWASRQPEVKHVAAAAESAGAYLACLAAEADTQADAYVFLGGFCGTCRELYDYNFGRLARYAETSPERKTWAEQHARPDLALGRHFDPMIEAAAHGKDQFDLADGDFHTTMGLARRREELKDPPTRCSATSNPPPWPSLAKKTLTFPQEHTSRIARRIHAASNTNVASLIISACDHNFQWSEPDKDLAFRERYTFDSFKRAYNTDVYAAMLDWLRKVLPSPANPAQTARTATPPYQRAIPGPERDPKKPITLPNACNWRRASKSLPTLPTKPKPPALTPSKAASARSCWQSRHRPISSTCLPGATRPSIHTTPKASFTPCADAGFCAARAGGN